MANSNDHQHPYDEAAEVRCMKEECDSMAREMLLEIDLLLRKIDSILEREVTDEN